MNWVKLIEICVPMVVALIPILPTILSSASKTRKSIDAVEKKLDAHIKDDEWNQAKQRRIRILRFYDEICAGVNHSENHYEEILDDIDQYTNFCKKHSDYTNHKGKIAMDYIENEYDRRKRDGLFVN